MKKIFSLMLLCAAVVFAGCSKDDDNDPTTPTISVEKVTLSKATLSLKVGGTETLIATVAPEGVENKTVTWTSSKPAIATIDDKGLVTAIGVGNTTITVTSVADNTKTATCTVTVKSNEPEFGNEGEEGIDGSSWDKAYTIENKEQLMLLATRVKDQNDNWAAKYYKQTADIALTANDLWIPIGMNSSKTFKGHFDGGNHQITGTLKITTSDMYAGIFGYGYGAEIKNLHFAGSIDLTASTSVSDCAAIIGDIRIGTISHCSNTADITSAGYAAGIASSVTNSKIIACTNSGSMTATGSSRKSGGIAAVVYPGNTIIGNINKGNNFTAPDNAGGIAGYADGTTIACWSLATSVTGANSSTAGSIAGMIIGTVTDCYWKEVADLKGAGYGTITNTKNNTFTGDKPSTEQIAAMNAAWQTADPNREYQFNATTGEIEQK